MGSVHALSAKHYPLPREFESAFADSDTLAVEVNLNEVPPEQMYGLLSKLGHYQEGDLRSHLTAETLASLENYLATTDQQLEEYLNLKPWLVSLQISSRMLRAAGYDPRLGVDQYFLEKARDILPVLELESVEEQLRMLADEPPLLQDKALRSSLTNMDRLGRELDHLIAAWAQGDAEGMYQIAMELNGDDPELNRQLAGMLDARNRGMAKKIAGYLEQSGRYLVIVGALHIGGEPGLLERLGKQYPITQIKRCGAS